jgi:hypothetical protein
MSKYKIIVKVDDVKFLKYHSDNLVNFTGFLDNEYPSWRWFNVYDSKSEKQIANYTRNSRPKTI